jgi:hypothetical protein
MPIDFSLLSSKDAQINGISKHINKRTSGYKRRENALQSKPEQIPDMIKRALISGIEASYVLMDSWFTMPPLVKAIVDQGLDVIGMIKETKQRYNVNGKMVSLKQLYHLAHPFQSKKGILRSIHTIMANGTHIKVVFIQNRIRKATGLPFSALTALCRKRKSFESTESVGILRYFLRPPNLY